MVYTRCLYVHVMQKVCCINILVFKVCERFSLGEGELKVQIFCQAHLVTLLMLPIFNMKQYD